MVSNSCDIIHTYQRWKPVGSGRDSSTGRSRGQTVFQICCVISNWNFRNYTHKTMPIHSGVDRVPCALGQKYFCAPTNKTAEFESKNMSKSAEEAMAEHLLLGLLFFSSSNNIAFSVRNAFNKAVTVDGSNNAGVWGRSPQSPEANGGLRMEPPTLQQF